MRWTMNYFNLQFIKQLIFLEKKGLVFGYLGGRDGLNHWKVVFQRNDRGSWGTGVYLLA